MPSDHLCDAIDALSIATMRLSLLRRNYGFGPVDSVVAAKAFDDIVAALEETRRELMFLPSTDGGSVEIAAPAGMLQL
jgi:hypothetical protein